MTHQCFHTDCPNPAPYGYGLPGLHSDKPKGKRGYLYACAEHRDEAEQRRLASITAVKK